MLNWLRRFSPAVFDGRTRLSHASKTREEQDRNLNWALEYANNLTILGLQSVPTYENMLTFEFGKDIWLHDWTSLMEV